MREWKEARVHNKWSKKWDASLIRPKVKRCAYIIIAFIGKDRVMRNKGNGNAGEDGIMEGKQLGTKKDEEKREKW